MASGAVFYKGYKDVEGRRPGTRDIGAAKPSKFSPETARGRMVYEAKSKMTAMSMRVHGK